MSCVHYKFSSKLDYNTVTFDGLHITLNELKRQIMARERLKATDCDLQITNAQTREEYTDDEIHIPKHSSVIVRRTPIGGVKPAGRTFIIDRSDTAMVGSSRPTDSSPSMSLAQLSKTANLADANASEEDKIKAMISQSIHDYDPIHYSKKAIGPPPGHYICFRCGKTGHYIRQCPLQMDKSLEGPKPVKISKGIPQSFMVKAEPDAKGAMLTSTGEYAIPAIDAEAYAQGKKERPPFVPRDQSASEDESDPIPDELLCPICNDLMSDAVVIPCCGNSYCDDCIRTSLLDSEEHVCYTCKQSDVSPDNLIANKFLRQAVNNFKNETGYTKHGRKQLQQVAPSAPRPLPPRHVPSRQQDPLMAHGALPAPRALPPAAVVPPQPPAVPPPPAVSAPPPAAIVRQDTPPLAPQRTQDSRDRQDNRDIRDNREILDDRDNREHHDDRDARDTREHDGARGTRDHHDDRDTRDHRDPRHDPRDQHHHQPRDQHHHDAHSPMQSGGPREPPPPGEADHDPHMMMNQGPPHDGRPQNCHHPLIGHPPPPRPLHHQQGPPPRPHQPPRGGGPVGGGGPRHWDRNFRPREDHPPPRMQVASFQPNTAPPVYAAPALYPPPPQIYPPPYSTGPGLIPPPPVGYQPQPMYPPGMQGLNPPWMPPNNQHPLGPRPPPLNQPHLSKEEFYRQHHLHHHPDEVTSKLDEFTKDFHKQLMKYCNAPKRRRRSYTRSRTYSRSPFSRSPFSRSRSRSRSYSYTPSRSRSRSRNRSYPRSPFSRRNGRSYGRTRSRSRSRSRPYAYRRSGSPRSPGPYRPPGGQGWDGADGAAFRSRSRSRTPGGFRRVSPGGGGGAGGGGGGGRKPPPREPPPFDGRDMSPGAHERWERDGYRQWERDYRDYYKYYRDYDGQPAHHRVHGSRDRERDRLSPPPRDYSPQGKSRRGRDADRGAPSFHQPSSSSSGTKTSSKSSKSKKVKKKKNGDESEAAHQSMDRGDATPVRDEPMDDAPNLSKTPPSSSKSSSAAKAATSKSSSTASAKTSTKSGKTSSDKSKKDKTSKVKVKVKTEASKVKGKKAVSDAAPTKKKEGSSSSSSTAAATAPPPPSPLSKSSKTSKAPGPEEASIPAVVKKDKAKAPAPRPVPIKPRLVSSRIHPPPPQVLLDTPRPVVEIPGGRDPLKNAGLLPLPMQHGLLMLPHHPSFQMDKRRRPGEERPPFLLGLPPNKLRCIGVPGMGVDRLPHTQMVLPAQLLRVPSAMDRPGILPTPGVPRDPGRGDMGQRDLGQRDLGQRDLGQRDLGQRDLGQRELGQRDLGQRDLGQRDLGQRDLGQRDLGQRDLGQRDLGQRDLGQRDLGQRDAGQRDLGQRDMGRGDMGQRDLGQRDLGQRDLGQRDVGQRDMGRGDIRPLMDLQVKPMAPRRIKLNRDLGRKNSTEGPSTDKPPAGPEKTTSATDKASSGSTPTGERPTRVPEPTGRRERSVSRERGGSREGPGSGRERDQRMGLDRDRDRVSGADRERDRIPGSDRERDRIPGLDRERDTNLGIDRERDRISRSDRDRDRDRDRISGSDRDRERVSGSDRDRDRLPGSDRERDRGPASDRERDRLPGLDKGRERAPGSGKERDRSRGPDRERGQSSDSDRHREKTSAALAAEKMAVTVERDFADGQRLVKTDKSNPGGSGAVARSVSVDKMTIAERSAIARKPAEPAEKTRRPSKEKDAESSEKGPKTDRGVSKDRAERTGTSGEKPAAAHREAGKGSDASATKSRSRVNRKALTSRSSGSRPAETGRSDSDQNQRSGSSKDSDPRSQSPGDGRKHSPTPEPSPGRVEVLIQPPPRSKWERDDEEEWPDNGLAAPAEKPASPPRGREKEKHPDAPKPVKSLARDGPKEEKRGAAKEEKTTTPAATTTTGKGVKQEGKAVKTSQAVKAKAPRDESRGHGRTDGRSGEREEAKGVAAKEERAPGGAGREESRGPEPRRQRLCSDLGRETDEAAFVPDYSEGEGSEPQKGGSVSASPSHSVASGSPAHSNASGSVATTATGDKKKKKKRKKDKKHKKHKKHSGQDAPEDAESKERKHKHKKKKHKKSKEAEEAGSKTPQE